jgi:hypothetical protein
MFALSGKKRSMRQVPETVEHLMKACVASPGERADQPLLGVASQTAVFEYWRNLPRPTGIPDASAFNPAAVKRYLPNLTILSLNSPDEISHRLVGTEVRSRIDTNLTGANLLDFVPPETRLQCTRDMHEMGYRPCAWQARHVTRYASGLTSNVLTLYLPLRAPEGQPPRILGMHKSEETSGYEAGDRKTVFGAHFDRMVWIDVGFGVPG